MKKYIIGILVVLLVISISGCITDNNNSKDNSTNVQTISQNGVLVRFPADWVLAEAQSNDSVISIASSASLDSSKVAKVNVNVEKRALSGSFDTMINSTYTSLMSNSSNQLISLGDIKVGDQDAKECIYTSTDNGEVKQHKAVWINQGSNVYVILCTAPQDQFDSQLKYFDYIINNIKIT